MMLLVCAILLQAEDLVSRALLEGDKEKRQTIVSQLRRLDIATVEKALHLPVRGKTKFDIGKIFEQHAKSDLDGEEFTYVIHVPVGYDPSHPWPLLITLHGANLSGNPNAGAEWIQNWLRCGSARREYVILSPTTTRHTWAARQGHFYVLTALREAIDDLNVDPDRVFLDGMSMGAGGTFGLAEHYPDRWAAIGPRCSVPDIRQKKDKTYVTMLADNFHNVPVYWVVGAKDEIIPIDMVRAAKADLDAAKGELVYREIPDGGHTWGLEKDDVILAWYGAHKRVTYPEDIVWKSYEKIFARAWWVEVTKRTDPPPLITVHLDMKGQESERRIELRPPAVVRARRKGNSIEIACEEVKELRVYLDDATVELDKPVTITVNGKKLHDGIVKRSVDTLIEEARRRHDTSMTFSASVDLRLK